LLTAALLLVRAIVACAEPAPFDLAGPRLESHVTRATRTLQIGAVPNLAAGDRLWIKADLPATQSERYLLVLAFLRGATNPPPPEWFFRCETWKQPCAGVGLNVVVPAGAEQVLVFLAPQAAGDFKTLMSAVRGRPGAFVRASQDLNQATLDRSRLTTYLQAIRTLDRNDPAHLKEAAPLLARSLAIKVEEKCLDRITELQAACLMQGQSAMILNDGHSASIVEALTSGPASDLAMEASYTPQLSYGYYSPYVASVLDIARIFDSFRTPQYQYIPALAAHEADRLALTLNTAPSFHNPKSVLVTALPAVEQVQLPPLHAIDPKQIYCARKTALVLPVEGAPLVFSTAYAHDMVLSLTSQEGKTLELPVRADAEQGGFVVDTSVLGVERAGQTLGERIRGSLQGYWGFEPYQGPVFELANAREQKWALANADEAAPIVGRAGTVHLKAASVSCVDGVMIRDPAGKELKVDWKPVKPDQVEVRLPLEQAQPGALTLLVSQYGATEVQPVTMQAFAEPGRLDTFVLHSGETQGILTGSRLDQVAGLTLKGVTFSPAKLTVSQAGDELAMVTDDAQTAAGLRTGDAVKAKVTLKDGRVAGVNAIVDAPRPSASLIGKSVQGSLVSGNGIRLAGSDEVPQGATLTFSVRAQTPGRFSRDVEIEVATADESASTVLGMVKGGMTLENAHVAVVTLDPQQAFGPSAYGPLRFRVVANGVAGVWVPLATLVRLPVLRELKCPPTPDLACKLSGSNLFLVDSISSDPAFGSSVQVPDGFPGDALPVPHPTDGRLYVKLRDDPAVVSPATLGEEHGAVPAADKPPPQSLASPAAAQDEEGAGHPSGA
jgi:hypothetical protein